MLPLRSRRATGAPSTRPYTAGRGHPTGRPARAGTHGGTPAGGLRAAAAHLVGALAVGVAAAVAGPTSAAAQAALCPPHIALRQVASTAGMPPAAPADTNCARPRGPALALSLADAVSRGTRENEQVGLAESQLRTAQAQISSARASLFPQLSGQLSYQRAIRQPFQLGGFSIPDSLGFNPDPNASFADRIRYLEQRTPTAALGALGGLFSGAPLGQANTYVGTINVNQTVFDWRAVAGLKGAREFESAQRAQLTDQQLDVTLQIVTAYHTAVLNERLAEIATASFEEANRQLQQVRLREAAGNAARLDVLRAAVDRDNLEPQRIQALNARDLAVLDLKRLVDVPLAQPVHLTDSLTVERFRPAAAANLDAVAADALRRRPALEAARRQVAIDEQRVAVARAAYLPSISVSGAFGKQGFPASGLPGWGDLRDNWTVGVGVSVPLFSGGQRRADVQVAQEQVRRSELQLTQAQKQAALDVTQQRAELERAQAAIAARRQTVRQAAESYELTLLSFEKGNATQLQVSDARFQLRQAQVNEVQAVFDYTTALSRFLRAAGVAPTPAALADLASARR